MQRAVGFTVGFTVALTAFLLPACARDPDASPGSDQSAPASDAPSSTDAPRSSPTAWVKVVAPSDLSLVELPAQVVGEAGSRTAVTPVFEGQVVAVHVRPGDEVEASDPIADISTPEVTRARAVVRSTKEQLALQRDRLAELERLRDQGLVGTKEVFAVKTTIADLESERSAASATLAAARAGGKVAVRDGALTLRASSSGTVTQVNVAPGQIRGPNDGPLAVIVHPSLPRIETSIAGPFPPSSEAVFEGRTGGEVALDPHPIATAIDPEDGMTQAWLVPLDESVTLTDGLRGTVILRAKGGTDAGAVADLFQVPVRALRLQSQGQSVVLVRGEGSKIREVPVEVRAQSGSSALVSSEQLRIGDEVAADPAMVLGAPQGEGGHGH